MSAAAEPLIALRGVARTFGPTVALDDVDLDVTDGSLLALLGGNGAGKTTLLRVIAGLATPTAGTVRVAGVDRRKAGPGLRAMLGYVGHEPMLYGDLTLRENLDFTAQLHEVADRSTRVEEVAAEVGVAHGLDRPVRTLSRGNAQRGALARALLPRPWILLLDEPFTGLDLDSVDRVMALLADLHRAGSTLLLTLHDPTLAAQAERVVVLDAGRVVVDEPPGDVASVTARLRAAQRGGLAPQAGLAAKPGEGTP